MQTRLGGAGGGGSKGSGAAEVGQARAEGALEHVHPDQAVEARLRQV